MPIPRGGAYIKRRLVVILLVLLMVVGVAALPAGAAVTWPNTLGAPEHFGASHYIGDYFNFYASAPDDVRAVMADIVAAGGSTGSTIILKAQLDMRLDGGDWRYTSAWDTAKAGLKNTLSFGYSHEKRYIDGLRASLSVLFPDDAALLQPIKTGGPGSHTFSFRLRYVHSFDNGATWVYSAWSDTFVYAMNVKVNPDEYMNHAPTLVSAQVTKNAGGSPILIVKTGRLPGTVQDLNAMSSASVWTEVWLRRPADQDWKLIGSQFFSHEYIQFDVDDYFDKLLPNYDATQYEVKIRYRLDLRAYKQSGRSDTIYSPFSNVLVHEMPAWSGASEWATPELEKAEDYGLIPPILRGADMTRPINREEFAELAITLYEKVTGATVEPASPNPFVDTQNPRVLMAYAVGITKGTSATTFTPAQLIPREQVATMLSRAIRQMVPGGDFSTDGAPVFSDQGDISGYAVEHVLFMAKIGVIKGSDGKFMPRALTPAQEAAGYARNTREQALAMSVRIFEKYRPQ